MAATTCRLSPATWTLSTSWRTTSTESGRTQWATTRRSSPRRPTASGANNCPSITRPTCGSDWVRRARNSSSACRPTAAPSRWPTRPVFKLTSRPAAAELPAFTVAKPDFSPITRCVACSVSNIFIFLSYCLNFLNDQIWVFFRLRDSVFEKAVKAQCGCKNKLMQ